MKEHEFLSFFPRADRSKFIVAFDNNVVYRDKDGVFDVVDSPAFWENPHHVAPLFLSPHDYNIYLENKNGFLAYKRRVVDTKHQVNKNQSRLSTWLNLDEIQHVGEERVEKEKQNDLLEKRQHWGPIEWNVSLEKKTPVVTREALRDAFDLEHFRAYVTEQDYFMVQFSLGKSSEHVFDTSDLKNVYAQRIKAMVVLSYLGGMSLRNLTSDNKIAASLAHFYFYYFLQKVKNFPTTFQEYSQVDSLLEKFSWQFHQSKRHWVWYHPRMKMDPSEFKRKSSDVIENIHRSGKKVFFDIVGDLRHTIQSDYKTFLRKTSHGSTKLGQTLFQESTQVYVYCILASQVSTRWKIVNDGVKSLQTQAVFQHQMVPERIATNNLTKLISDLRVAIRDSKVRLDFCISPNLILIPSNMVFIQDSPGYNNIITIANSGQPFGVNTTVNTTYRKVVNTVKSASNTPTSSTTAKNKQESNKNITKIKQTSQPLNVSSQQSFQDADSNVESEAPVESNLKIFGESLLASLFIRMAITLF